ncbi:MAG: TetR family transcriptional regulator [Planctomycetes bacterium]|nr:TetR family transcriptional regulator [Planctomycetota bacterium]
MARPIDVELRARLVLAATEAFARQGFGATTMTGVGAAAGVTKGGVYFHFRSKEELFFAVLDHWRGALRERLDRAAVGAASGAAALVATLRAFLALHVESPAGARLLRVLTGELQDRLTAAIRADAREEHRALRARLRDALIQGGRDGSAFAGDPVLASFLLAASVLGLVDQWLAAPRDVEPFLDPAGLAEALAAPWLTGREPDRRGDEGAHPFVPPAGPLAPRD